MASVRSFIPDRPVAAARGVAPTSAFAVAEEPMLTGIPISAEALRPGAACEAEP